MTPRLIAGLLCFGCFCGGFCQATIVDRIAIVIGNRLIKDSDIEQDLRITAFLNNQQPGFTPAARKKAASRLIDQLFIRDEIELGEYPVAAVANAQSLLADLKKSRFASDAAYERALASYGIAEDDLKARLLWQLTVLRFIDIRFRPGALVTDEEITKYYEEHKQQLRASHPGKPAALEDLRAEVQDVLIGERVNRLLDEWLSRRRKAAKIIFLEEALA